MTLEASNVTETPSPAPSNEEALDEALGAIFDKASAEGIEADEGQAETAAQRDERGRFAKAEQASEGASPPKEPEGEPDEGQTDAPPDASTASLPANWRPDMADIWAKLPEPERDRLGKWSQELHGKMSEQGRQLSQLRDFAPLVEHMTQAFPHKFGPGGVPPVQGLAALVDAAYALDRQPVETIMQLAQESGVLPQLAQALGAQGGGNVAALQQTIHQLRQELGQYASPNAIQQQIDQAMSVREVASSVERFKSEKPFYAEVEADLPSYIEIAWTKKPDGTPQQVLDMAYDMAVNADPAVREKARAAAVKAAASKPDPKRAAAAKTAASINVTSTSTGKSKPRSEEDAYGEVWDRRMATG